MSSEDLELWSVFFFFCVCLCLHSLLGPTFECHLFSLRSASTFSSQKFLYLPKQVQTGKGTMYLPLTQFSLRSASTFPKRDQKGKGSMYLLSQCDQCRSRVMVSFSCVCLCLHSLLGPTFECHLFFSQNCLYHVLSQKCLYLPFLKQGQTGKGTMYLLLTQFPLKSASTFPTKRPKKAKEPCIFDQ